LTKPFQSIRTLIATVKELIEPAARKTEKPEKPEKLEWPGAQPPAAAVSGVADATPSTPAEDAGAAAAPQTGGLLTGPAESREAPAATPPPMLAPAPEREDEWRRATTKLPDVPPFPAASDSRAFFADDGDILELDDVLPTVPVLYQPQPLIQPPAVTSTITQAVKVTAVEAITTTTIPQSVIDDIVNRVAAQVTAQLLEILPDRLTAKLAQELSPQLTSQVAEAVKQTLPTARADNYANDLLLDLE
jgi:hypothetical protein